MSATSTQPRVGFAGLGRMGVHMAGHIAKAGFDLTVYNRTAETAICFAEANQTNVASTARALAEECSIIVLMVADGPALVELIEGDQGLAKGLAAGDVVVDMGTTGIEGTQLARDLLREVGADLVEAPVSGSTAAAEAKLLLVMTGGEPAAVATVRPVLEAIAGRIVDVGGPGTGAAMKLAVNAVLFGINQAIAESLVLAERAGIERTTAYEVFASSAVAAPVVHYRRDVFENPGETPVTFSVDLAVKDLDLILGIASDMQLAMPQTEANFRTMVETSADGLGSADMGDVAVHLRRRPPVNK